MNNKLHDYTIVVNATITLATCVRAYNIDEALRFASEREVIRSLCQRVGDHDTHWATSVEMECDPTEGTIVEVWEDNRTLTSDELDELEW